MIFKYFIEKTLIFLFYSKIEVGGEGGGGGGGGGRKRQLAQTK